MLRQKISIDLGTDSTVICVNNGIALREPSVVTVFEGKVIAAGIESKAMVGKTPKDVTTIRPIQESVVADFEMAEQMLMRFLLKVRRGAWWRARGRSWWRGFDVALSLPSEMTEVEKRAMRDCAIHAGATHVYRVESAIASAVGAGMPVQDATGNFVINIGSGTTEIAIISLSGIVFSKSINIAGNHLDDAVIEFVRRKYNLLIGELAAEEVKMTIGSVVEQVPPITMDVAGRDLVTGLHHLVTISSDDVQEALMGPVQKLLSEIKQVLEKCPPALSLDLVQHGVMLAGGGACLRGLATLIRDETKIDVHVSEDPIGVVAAGIGKSWKLNQPQLKLWLPSQKIS